MEFDPTVSLGTLISAAAVCVTIVGSGLAFYVGVTKHMTKNEQQIEAMLQRIEDLEKGQQEHAAAIAGLAKLVAAGQAVVGIVQNQVQALYNRAIGLAGG